MALDVPTLRQLLAKFLPDFRLIKAFEQWGDQTNENTETAITALNLATEAQIQAVSVQQLTAEPFPDQLPVPDTSQGAPCQIPAPLMDPGTLTAGTGLSGGGNMGANVEVHVPAKGITYSLIQDVTAASRILGRGSASGSGVVQEITLGTGISISGTTINASGSGGTVTTVSVVTANGVSGSVANPTTTPAITLTLGAITPSSVAASGTVTGSNLSGTNTGDQTITLSGAVSGSGTSGITTSLTNANLNAIAGLSTAADRLSYWTGSGTAALTTITSQSRTNLAASKLAIIDDSPFITGANLSSGSASLAFGSTGAGSFFLYTNNLNRFLVDTSGNSRPGSDNAYSLGTSGARWSVVYAATGTINTSDERAKEQISAIPDEWLDAWSEVDWCRFKFRDSVAEKGDSARWHIGLIAQRVREVFNARGLDAMKIGLLCFDSWKADKETALEAGDRWGLRYEECLAMEAAWHRREINRLKESLS